MVHSIHQITVMTALMFFGQYMFFDKPFSIQRPPYGQVDEFESDRKKLDTICFHSFVLMNVFNMINCRVLDTDDTTQKNVFKSLFQFKSAIPPVPEHSFFWAVLVFEFVVQHAIIMSGNNSFG